MDGTTPGMKARLPEDATGAAAEFTIATDFTSGLAASTKGLADFTGGATVSTGEAGVFAAAVQAAFPAGTAAGLAVVNTESD